MDYTSLTKPYMGELLKAIKHFVSIPSVYDKESVTNDMPYGKYIDNALKEFAKLGEMYGFNVDLNNRYCELSLGDKGPLIEIYGHLDVVPANNPSMFNVTTKDNILYGRGVADDKGPLLTNFYAIKALKDNGLIKDVRIKIFAGGDEERGSSCLHYYVNEKHKEMPKYGFTPDSRFPMVYAEKGIGNITLRKNVSFKNVISISGGTATNVVIAKAIFKVDNINEIKDKIACKHEINNDEITFIGAAAHGATPQKGINAFLLGLNELGKINSDKEMLKLYNALSDCNGKNMNAYAYGEHLKETTYNIGVVSYTNNQLDIKINYRTPENADVDNLLNNVMKAIDASKVDNQFAPHILIDLKSDLVNCLLDAYQKETGDFEHKPATAGGGTYAKELKNTLAFGAEFPSHDYKMHQDEEYLPLNHLEKQLAIYAHAIHNLIKRK